MSNVGLSVDNWMLLLKVHIHAQSLAHSFAQSTTVWNTVVEPYTSTHGGMFFVRVVRRERYSPSDDWSAARKQETRKETE